MMNLNEEVSLSGIAFSLGEEENDYSKAENFDNLLVDYTMTDMPDYWGWGKYRKASSSIYELLTKSIEKTISSVPISASGIDLVIFCSGSSIENFPLVNEKLGRLIHNAGIHEAFILGQCFTGCVSIFTAIKLSNELLKADVYKNILIITSDVISHGVDRFKRFALYSDSSSSFIMSKSFKGDYKILNVAISSSPELMSGLSTNHDSHFKHLNSVHNKLLTEIDLKATDFEKIFMTNLYIPLTQINSIRLGYGKEKGFYENIKRLGHCFSSDPLINLIDYRGANLNAVTKNKFMLAAMSTGHAGFCAIEEY